MSQAASAELHRSRPRSRRRQTWAVAAAAMTALQMGGSLGRGQPAINVLTYHNDNARTGQNLQETILTPANVNSNTFGKLFAYPLDGWVFAQPLFMSGLAIPGQGTHNVVFVATEHDSVYALDADAPTGANAGLLWRVNFLNPAAGIDTVPISAFGYADPPELGITGTPVIDPGSGTLFVVAKTQTLANGGLTYAQQLHALDIYTGEEKPGSPVAIEVSVAGKGVGSDSTGQVPFDAFYEFQRPGLLLQKGVVYLAFASQGDVGPYHGWVLGYDAQTLRLVQVHNTTPNGGQGGIWMSGAGPAADADGNIYFITGNGTFDADSGGTDFGDSIVKLVPQGTNLNVGDYFTAYDQDFLNSIDGDLGSGGVMVLPDSLGSQEHPRLAIGCGKDGNILLVDRDNLGHFNPENNSQIVQELPEALSGGCWSMPACLNNWIYYQGVGDVLKAYKVADGLLSPGPVSQSSVFFGYPGATPSISAAGTTNGIIWAVDAGPFQNQGAAVLHAFNATNLAEELYNSTQAGDRDSLTLAQKFTVPTVAHGRVYVASALALSVFGTLGSPSIASQPVSQIVLAGSRVELRVAALGTPPLAYQWQFNGTNVGGATNTTLTLGNLDAALAGSYSAVVSNSQGSVASLPASLSVMSLDRLGGLSLAGPIGSIYRIDYQDTLGPTNNWQSSAQLLLDSNPLYYTDPQFTNRTQRYYRTVLLAPAQTNGAAAATAQTRTSSR